MKNEIKNNFEELGVTFTTPRSHNMIDFFNAVESSIPLYHSTWENVLWENDWCNTNSFSNPNYFFSVDTPPCGQTLLCNKLFTPLTPNTTDYNEWHDDFEEDQDIDLTVVREIVGKGDLEFLQVFESYGYPDYFFICLSDPNPESPTLFSTDHEHFFLKLQMKEH